MTYRKLLRDQALDQRGFITTRDAQDLGIPPVELRKIAARGGLDNVAYGLYRIPDAPRTDLDQYAEAVLRVGRDAYLTHDAVLAVHHLAQVNPSKIRVATPYRIRSGLPGYIQIEHRHLPEHDLMVYEGIPSTTVARALLDCRGLVMPDRLRDALRQAEQQGLVTRREAARLRVGRRETAAGKTR